MALMTWDNDGVEQWASRIRGRCGAGAVAARLHRRGQGGAELIRDTCVRMSEPVRLVTFDIDELLDYRSRRPEMTFSSTSGRTTTSRTSRSTWSRDADGTPFLLLHGSEPDIRWEAFIARGARGRDRLGVEPHARARTAFPWGRRTPSRRRPPPTARAKTCCRTSPGVFGTVTVPASAPEPAGVPLRPVGPRRGQRRRPRALLPRAVGATRRPPQHALSRWRGSPGCRSSPKASTRRARRRARRSCARWPNPTRFRRSWRPSKSSTTRHGVARGRAFRGRQHSDGRRAGGGIREILGPTTPRSPPND